MPDPLLYLRGMGVAAIASALFVLAVVAARRSASSAWRNSVSAVGIGFGLALGCNWLALSWQWPPANGLNRFLTIVLPAVLLMELISGLPGVSVRIAWLLRTTLSAMIPRILLHGSVYLRPGEVFPALWPEGAILLTGGFLLAGCWWLLVELSQRPGGIAVPLAIGMATLCGGLTILLAGYLKGGAAAFPLIGAILGTTLGAALIAHRNNASTLLISPAVTGTALVGLFGLLFVGCSFGRLPVGRALVILLAPLLCWSTRWSALRPRNPWVAGLLRLALVAIPLLAVLVLAKRDFDRTLAPLISDIAIRIRG